MHIGKHVSNIKKGIVTHNVSKHFSLCHNRAPTHLKFWGAERVKKHWRGGNFMRQLSRREWYWIYKTKVPVPLGLNFEFDLNCLYLIVIVLSTILYIIYIPDDGHG